jgi:hypothetical protein
MRFWLQQRWVGGGLLAICLSIAASARADEPPAIDLAAEVMRAAQDQLPNQPFRVLGGAQYWNDVQILGGWRIQRNVLTGHHRLLDNADLRQCWGDLSACQTQLKAARAAGRAIPARGEVVVVLHGLASGRWAMRPLGDHLRNAGFEVVDVGYSTTSGRVADHAATLARVIQGLPEAESLHFVAHSLGNLVVRRYLADEAGAPRKKKPKPRLGRMVMLAPPNQGSAKALSWSENALVVKEMGPGWKELEPRLATPSFEFAIIAGGLGDEQGLNPSILGDDDGTLAVEETRLAGAKEHLVVPSPHSLLVYREDVLNFTTNFLRHGRCAEEEE